ncbi:MAG: group II intron reverse transcriptase/maturase, partial [Methylococcaceae bacterium]
MIFMGLIKVHSLTGRITPEVMQKAFKKVKRNRGAAGIDKVSIQMFEANLGQNLDALMRDLKTGVFQPRPLRRVFIDKGNGKLRPLGIPAVRDRIAQEVVRQLLEPLFEPLFHECSFGFRPGRNCHLAVEQVLKAYQDGFRYVLDADIQGFFDNLPHSVIMAALTRHIADGNILNLVQRFLTAGVMLNGVFKPTTVGTPQGGVLSPLLANLALHSLDQHLDQHGLRFVRYADDFVVLTQTQHQAQEALPLVAQHLETLGLALSPEKTKITSFGRGFDFLGFKITANGVRMRDKSVEKLKDKVRDITRRSHNLDAKLILRLNQVIRGTANYFATPFTRMGDRFRKLDSWIRMRLRCMK